jgi:hypothetical protein
MSFGTTGPKKGVKGASSRSVALGSSPKTTGKRGDSGWLFGLRRQKSWVRIPPRPQRFQWVSDSVTTHRRRDWSPKSGPESLAKWGWDPDGALPPRQTSTWDLLFARATR